MGWKALAGFAILMAAGRDDAQRIVLPVPDGGTLAIELPKDWKVEKIQPRPTLPPTLRILAPNAAHLSLQVTMMRDKDGKLGTEEELRKTLERSTARFVSGSVEKKQTIVALESKTVKGFHATFTDASLVDTKPVPEGKYLTMTSGILGIGKNVAAFTLLSNEGGEALTKSALEALSKISLEK
jgi:hypothetical protein